MRSSLRQRDGRSTKPVVCTLLRAPRTTLFSLSLQEYRRGDGELCQLGFVCQEYGHVKVADLCGKTS